MKIMERRIIKVSSGKWAEIQELEKKWDALEDRIGGFPAKRRLRSVAGSEDSNTFVWEREWESFAACEAAYEKMMGDPEAQTLGKESEPLNESSRGEFYHFLP